MNSGIYCIENLTNGKKYIGQSVNLRRRKYRHFYELKNNCHSNQYLQRAFNKYGELNFHFSVLIYCEDFLLTKYEQFFVNIYDDILLYNRRMQCTESNYGIRHSIETKQKISTSLLGHTVSEETRNKLSKKNMGKHLSEEHKNNIGIAFSGEKHPLSKITEEDVSKILDMYYNKKYTCSEVSNYFSVSRRQINGIVLGKSWKNCYNNFIKECNKKGINIYE